MKAENILPAVMMSVAAMSAIANPADAAITATNEIIVTDNIVPAVLFIDAKPDYQASDRLLKYEQTLMKETGYKNARRMDRCETISGSGHGWDDSKQDCKG
jgi:hypothetical protein